MPSFSLPLLPLYLSLSLSPSSPFLASPFLSSWEVEKERVNVREEEGEGERGKGKRKREKERKREREKDRGEKIHALTLSRSPLNYLTKTCYTSTAPPRQFYPRHSWTLRILMD
jgi:hypothetical protein